MVTEKQIEAGAEAIARENLPNGAGTMGILGRRMLAEAVLRAAALTSTPAPSQDGAGLVERLRIMAGALRQEDERALCNLIEEAASSLSSGWRSPTHRHKKSGHEVTVVAAGKMQANDAWRIRGYEDAWMSDTYRQRADMAEVVIYRHDGNWWVRPREEFEDGRFEPFPTPQGEQG